ncbi:RNA-directed DNA polymerase from mobile element jockey [Trichonephila clavipes]|uniref:RNA-directed DNA polymerase from mobile element jockey n=1 Tax=Trichonephila clavipes TaxID=2585209 RepID=A0A8X6SP10_TRICX|nr:RNA-directed DNA polymerase from mobile element jockey [Trichonephila clavipes]
MPHSAAVRKDKETTKVRMVFDASSKVLLNNSYSNTGSCLSGVPQGSVLSPYLYNIYAHDFPQHSTVSTCLFADDSAVLSQGVQLKYTIKTVQHFLDKLETWLTHWRIAINVDKSQAIVFRKWGVIDPPCQLSLFDDNIQWVPVVKYLGLHIDSRLTFKKHIDYLSEKFWGRISLAISLVGRRSPLSLENKVILYKQILCPVITYGSPVWGAAAATHMKKFKYRNVACFVTSSSPVPLKTRRVGQRCTLNLSRAETSSRWCGVVVRRGGASSDKGKDFQLHIFCDASPRVFGAVAYFRYVTANDDSYTSFITAKSRVSPLKKLTLPRLELLGAVLASRILKYLTSKFKFPISKFFLWSDSSIALHWIKEKASNHKQFVSNRVIEIQSNSDPSDWHHCSGRENPADYVSRGANLETIIYRQFWMHGPQWLRTTKNNWPKNLNCDFSSTDPCESEKQVFMFACEFNTASIIHLSKFSSLQKLLRVSSWVLRFVHNIRNRFNKRSDDLSTEEINGAEKFWIQLVQRDAFAEEVNCLRACKLLLKTSVILEFNPFLDSDELIRVGGRLQKSKFSYLQKHPIILPGKWCKFNGVQVTAPLPALRVEQSAPFSVVEIDFEALTQKTRINITLFYFLCAVTRALHLELVNILTTETFLLALRRFISRRGLCSKI